MVRQQAMYSSASKIYRLVTRGDNHLLFLGTLLSRVGSILIAPFVIVGLGTADYGKLELVTTFSSMVCLFITFAIDSYLARNWYSNESNAPILNAAFQTVLLMTILSLIVFIIIKFFINFDYINILVAILTSALMSLSVTLNTALRMDLKNKEYSVAILCQSLILIFGVIYLYNFLIFNLLNILIVIFISYLVSVFLSAFFCRNFFGANRLSNREYVYIIRSFCLPLIPALGLGVLNSYIDRYLVFWFLGLDQLGIFSVYLRVASIIGFYVVIFRQFWLPYSMKIVEKGCKYDISLTLAFYLISGFVLAFFVAIFYHFLAPKWNFPLDSSSVKIIFLCGVAAVLYGSSVISGIGIIGNGLTKYNSYSAIISFIINITLSIPLILVINLDGAVYGIVAGSLSFSILLGLFSIKKSNLRFNYRYLAVTLLILLVLYFGIHIFFNAQ
jgi:O-antigen/teichoic acid export membrane protein